jgi:hypothetical protein
VAATAAVGGAAGYARYLERLDVEVVRVSLSVGLPRPLRVVAIGDIHFDPFFEREYVERVVAIVNGLAPDLVLHTGDVVSHGADRLDDVQRALGRISPRLGHLGILGNHDQWVDAGRVTATLQRAGIDVLRNRATPLPSCEGWWISGLDSVWAGRPDPAVISATAPDARHLVLVHEPDVFERWDDSRVALQISGHTHGGQVRVPGYGAISLPRWGKRYQMGAFSSGGRQLYVHRGLGTVDDHVRLNCRPEIALLALT